MERRMQSPNKQPLERRIVIAFALMTLIVSGTFSLGIVAIVHFIEEHLVSEELSHELEFAMRQEAKGIEPAWIDASTKYYSSRNKNLPAQYAHLPDGFSEVVATNSEAYYVFKRSHEGHQDILEQEQHEFEAREQALFDVVLGGFLLSVVGAWGLGRLLARRVMTPVRRLAQQVRHRDQLLPMAPKLAPDYPDDEVGRLAAAFDETLGQLRHSLERERLFTSDVSHELRTPLMVISSSCELLSTSPRLTEHEQSQVDRINRAGTDMKDLVQTFLQLARVGLGQTSLTEEKSLSELAVEQARQWGPHFEEKGLSFHLLGELDNNELYDSALLRTVMSNLLRNALHYTETGEVRLIVEAGGFRVEDTGPGISQNDRERIFNSFVRGESARGEGLGLGLSIVRRICQQKGWKILVESQEKIGSRFSIVLSEKA